MEKHKRFAIYYGTAFFLACLVGFLYYWTYWRNRIYTTDCYVQGNLVYITPLRDGFVTSIHTDNTFLCKKNELLVELDRTDSEIEYDKARQHLANVVRQVCDMFHDVFTSQAEIEVKKAELIKAMQDYEHREGVIEERGVSLEDFQHATAELRANYYLLRYSEVVHDKALSLVQGTSIRNHPMVLEAADEVRRKWVHLYRCNIYSPVEGLAAQRTIQVGMWVPAGTPLMSVIPLDQIWVNANYKETQLTRLKIGAKAQITADLYGRSVIFHGKVVGIPGAAGNAFSLLPPQNLTGNWIKIVQRLPVRIELDPEELKAHPLRIGLTCEATIDLTDEGPYLPNSWKGSPLYDTDIFQQEETGDRESVAATIEENLDPTLSVYATSPLFMTRMPIILPETIEQVCNGHVEEETW